MCPCIPNICQVIQRIQKGLRHCLQCICIILFLLTCFTLRQVVTTSIFMWRPLTLVLAKERQRTTDTGSWPSLFVCPISKSTRISTSGPLTPWLPRCITYWFGVHQFWQFWRYCIYCYLSWFSLFYLYWYCYFSLCHTYLYLFWFSWYCCISSQSIVNLLPLFYLLIRRVTLVLITLDKSGYPCFDKQRFEIVPRKLER